MLKIDGRPYDIEEDTPSAPANTFAVYIKEIEDGGFVDPGDGIWIKISGQTLGAKHRAIAHKARVVWFFEK